MHMEITCPHCHTAFPTNEVENTRWTCPSCNHEVGARAAAGGNQLARCRVCGNEEMYVQKDFPHRLGLTILVGALALSCVFYYWHWIVWTWAVLLGSVLVDAVLYWLVGTVTVCYRCQTRYRGFAPNPRHHPFELEIGEKYRQERLRRQAAQRSTS
ncbi:MAG: hypothetical protein RMJ19_10450 [Gemmatales bacterium]|nr:hypothetical protein [Gemmatales bacterium]MCS7160879.1 hypothetical protein [Gemmatales bacterium]MDW8176081.1 hypothetical protein [Gemmatales bacterium]MDW8222602.1 hypothetical protein [Gemmatales bacterium]